MTAQQDQLVAYLTSHSGLQSYALAFRGGVWPPPVPPTVDKLASEFLADAEFRALGLGSWLRTPDGQFIAQAVSQVIPQAYRPLFSLTVDALKLAASKQAEDGRRKAGEYALGVIVVAIVLAVAGRRG